MGFGCSWETPQLTSLKLVVHMNGDSFPFFGVGQHMPMFSVTLYEPQRLSKEPLTQMDV